MTFGIQNWLMMMGMAGVAIPLIIHLLNRRRFDIVDWGAMQFLQVSEVTRRKVFIEELLLMLLRMGLIALLVLCMAAPFAASSVFETLGMGENRDVVLVFDGSLPMSYTNDNNRSLQDKGVEWTRAFLDRLSPGDNVAVLQAREQVVSIVSPMTSDHKQIRKALDTLPGPNGVCDWPQAVEAAENVLRTSRRARREIILVGDQQKLGWADERAVHRWELLAGQLPEGASSPRLWKVELEGPKTGEVPNWTVQPLRTGRARASTVVDFVLSLQVQDQSYLKPEHFSYQIDRPTEPTPAKDQVVKEIPLPDRDEQGSKAGNGTTLPISFRHTFAGPGSHLVTVTVQPEEAASRDRLPADNSQDYAVMLSLVPVLLVDGLPPSPTKKRGADFLRVALAPLGDKTRLTRAKVVPLRDMVAALSSDVAEANTRPRVLVLCDVAVLSSDQASAIDTFVTAGGGVLVCHGPRCDSLAWNRDVYRGGDGFLPTSLEEAVGNEDQPIPTDGLTPDPAAHPASATFTHPALELFRNQATGGLGNARFPRWWKLARPEAASAGTAVVAAELTTHTPFLVEKKIGKGKVIQCAVPLENSWNTNLLEVLEFPILAHELIAYLAGSRGIDSNLVPGQPLVYQPLDDESRETATLQPPLGEPIVLQGEEGGFVHRSTNLPGVYRLTTSRNRLVYYVVQPDPRGAEDLAPRTPEENDKVGQLLHLSYTQDAGPVLAGPARDMWWLLMIGVIGLLCGEVWMTRRIIKGR
jgi:hypothetical protein